MPPRGARPGFKRGRKVAEAPLGLPYWMASQILGHAPEGFPEPCVPLPVAATDDEINAACHHHAQRLDAWLDAQKRLPDGAELPPTRTQWDGTVLNACLMYQEHPLSAFNVKIKANTRKSYLDSLKVIQPTVGRRLVRNLNVLDMQNWYDQWRKPAPVVLQDGSPALNPDGTPVLGPERVDRAYNAISMWKTVLRFHIALGERHSGYKPCFALITALDNAGSLVNFEKGGSSEQELTYQQTVDFIRAADRMAKAKTIPDDRALYMSIAVAAIFELVLRPKDVIGERPKTLRDREMAERRGATVIDYGGEFWTGMFTWERIPGWRWRMKTSKSKYRTAVNFDLTIYSLLFPLLDQVPHEQRTGAIVKGEHGYAIQERTFRKWFRPIAEAAGIPFAVKAVHGRAGGATEADEAGAGLDGVQTLLTHSKNQETTTARYRRKQDRQRVSVQELRERSRNGGQQT